ncbi:hypothetical protein ACFU6I_24125 [Streptomyces sp. NPDC057486]|uniref:hypothetical protein n=1 Tax=Streptomyces sp. NPDC057486 TaxID=3346145 RepID=UPI0036A2F46D
MGDQEEPLSGRDETAGFKVAWVQEVACHLARAETSELAVRTARWEPFDMTMLERYFGHALDYSFGPRQVAGLAEFARHTEHGAPTQTRHALPVAKPVLPQVPRHSTQYGSSRRCSAS